MPKIKLTDKRNAFVLLLGILLTSVLAFLLTRTNLNPTKSQAASILNFPADHGEHQNFNAEWWYLNLLARTTNEKGADKKDSAYVLSFTRTSGSYGLLNSYYDQKSNTFSENTVTDGKLSVRLIDGDKLSVKFDKGSTTATIKELPVGRDRKKSYKLTGVTKNIGTFDLTLKERTVVSKGFNKPLLWGCQGKISVFSPDDTFYYSIPDLDISGTITEPNGTKRKVETGKAWMDHQWFNSMPPSDWVGHYWSSMHLTKSGSVYDSGPHQAIGALTQIYKNGPKYTYWVKRNEDGTNQCGTDTKFAINSYGKSKYPSSWTISNNLIKINGNTISDNQIFPSLMGNFIEAASYFTGNISGTNITGLGFVETHLKNPK